MEKISCVIITYNEEKRIRTCLESVKWVDEIILVDSFSTDRTLEITKEYTDKIYQYKWNGFAIQRNRGMEHCNNEWILFLDADEYVTEPLKKKLKQLQEIDFEDSKGISAYWIKRLEHFLGKHLKYGSINPSRQPRLLRKSKCKWIGGVHAYPEVDGKIADLYEPIYHDSQKDFSSYLNRLDQYSTSDANDRWEAGRRHNPLRVIFSPVAMFIKCFFLKRGFLDGFHGYLFAIGLAFYFFMRVLKVWHREWLDKNQSYMNEEMKKWGIEKYNRR